MDCSFSANNTETHFPSSSAFSQLINLTQILLLFHFTIYKWFYWTYPLKLWHFCSFSPGHICSRKQHPRLLLRHERKQSTWSLFLLTAAFSYTLFPVNHLTPTAEIIPQKHVALLPVHTNYITTAKIRLLHAFRWSSWCSVGCSENHCLLNAEKVRLVTVFLFLCSLTSAIYSVLKLFYWEFARTSSLSKPDSCAASRAGAGGGGMMMKTICRPEACWELL